MKVLASIDGQGRQGQDGLQLFDGLGQGGVGAIGVAAGQGLEEAAEGDLAGAGAFPVEKLTEFAFEGGGVGAAEGHGGFVRFEQIADGDLGAALAGFEHLEEELLAGFVFGGDFDFPAEGGEQSSGLGAEVVAEELDAAGLSGVGKGDEEVEGPEDAERRHDGGGGHGEELDGGKGDGAGDEGMDDVRAGEEGGVGEDVTEFVADDAGEFAFIEEVQQAAVEEDAVEGAFAGPEFTANGVGVDVLGADQIDGGGVGREAELVEHLAGQADEGIAGVVAEAGIGADVLKALFVEEHAAGDEAKDAEGGEGEGEPGGPVGVGESADCPEQPQGGADGDFEAEDPAAEGFGAGVLGEQLVP